MKIIPAIDIIDGQCVRLTKGDFSQRKTYSNDPLEVAKGFEQIGATNLHVVDLDGARKGKVVNWAVVEMLTSDTNLRIDFGGGVRSDEDAARLLEYGVKQINVGSLAVKKPELVANWIASFGADRIILSADTRDNRVSISGWEETSSLMLHDFLRQYSKFGIEFVTCTDIDLDGMLSGPNINLYRSILEEFPNIKLTASGGVSVVRDLHELEQLGVYGVIIGKALYEGTISPNELQPFIERGNDTATT